MTSASADLIAANRAVGLPDTATVDDLIRHHRGNAGLAVAFQNIGVEERLRQAREHVSAELDQLWDDYQDADHPEFARLQKIAEILGKDGDPDPETGIEWAIADRREDGTFAGLDRFTAGVKVTEKEATNSNRNHVRFPAARRAVGPWLLADGTPYKYTPPKPAPGATKPKPLLYKRTVHRTILEKVGEAAGFTVVDTAHPGILRYLDADGRTVWTVHFLQSGYLHGVEGNGRHWFPDYRPHASSTTPRQLLDQFVAKEFPEHVALCRA